MRHGLKIAYLLGLVMTLNAQADTVYGRCDYKNVSLANLTCYGPATVKNCQIKGALNVHGALNLINSRVSALTVQGSLDAQGSTIDGMTCVYGPFNAENSFFNANVFSATSKFSLNNSTINGKLTIQSDYQVMVQLTKSIVSGTIVFSHAAGIVNLGHGSQLSKSGDAIINGKYLPYSG